MIPNEIALLFAETYTFILDRVLPPLKWSALEEVIVARKKEYFQTRNACANVLPILTCTVAGGDVTTAVPLAAAWVLYDLASDIFDDIQDQDGKDWPWNHWSPTKSMNVGLGAIAAGQISLANLSVSKSVQAQICSIWGQVLAIGAQGQSRSNKVRTLDDYFRQMAAKSGLIFATVTRSGALLASTDKNTLDQMHAFGLALGMMIQLKDDWRDLYAPVPVMGTSTMATSDLEVGHYSLPILYALSQTDSLEHPKLTQLLNAQGTPNVTAVCQLLEEMGAFHHTYAMALAYQQKALVALRDFPPEKVSYLADYVSGFFPS